MIELDLIVFIFVYFGQMDNTRDVVRLLILSAESTRWFIVLCFDNKGKHVTKKKENILKHFPKVLEIIENTNHTLLLHRGYSIRNVKYPLNRYFLNH